MSKTDKTETDKTEVKVKRKMLTPEQRVAKLEAELAAAKQQAQDKDRKRHAQLNEQYKLVVTKRDALNKKLEELESELDEVEKRLPAYQFEG